MLLNLLIMNSSNRRMVSHCSSRQLYQTKKTPQQNNGHNFGSREAPKSRGKGTRREALLEGDKIEWYRGWPPWRDVLISLQG